MTVALVAFLILFALLLTSTPISFSAALATAGGIFSAGNMNIAVIAQKMFESTNSFWPVVLWHWVVSLGIC